MYDELIDELSADDQKSVEKITEAISALDKQKSEYLGEYSTARKTAAETHVEFAHRIKRYYSRGTGNSTQNEGEKLAIVEAFLNGLSQSEATALRLCASAEELKDVTLLAKKASRSRSTGKNDQVSALETELLAAKSEVAELRKRANYPDRQEFGKQKRQGNCRFCDKAGHWWRECRKRARVQPNWKPGKQRDQKKETTKSDKK